MPNFNLKIFLNSIWLTCLLDHANGLSNENSYKVFKNYVHLGFESNLIENITKPAIINRFFCLSHCSKRNECKMVIENRQSCFLLNTCFDMNKISNQKTTTVYVKNEFCLKNLDLENLENNVQYIPTNSNITKKNSLSYSSTARSLIFLPNGYLASGHGDSKILFWNVDNGTIMKYLVGHSNQVNFLIVNKNSELISGSKDGKVKIWNINDGSIRLTISGPTEVSALAVLENEDLVCSFNDVTIKILYVNNGTEKATLIGHEGNVRSIVVLNDSFIASGCIRATVIIWNLKNNSIHKIFLNTAAAAIEILAVLKNGDIAIGAIDPIVRILNINEGKLIKNLTGHDANLPVNSLAVLPNGDLISGSNDKSIIIWNMINGTIIKRFLGNNYNIWSGLVSLAIINNTFFASASIDPQLTIWG